ncbi:MAG: 30S ribosomal protein S8e [Candidatus Woesearchaeota archaeon]
MAISQERSLRKPSGARMKGKPSKRLALKGSKPTGTIIGEQVRRTVRGRGGNERFRTLAINTVSLYDPKTKNTTKEDIIQVVDNSASAHFVRRNIVTKGAIIETKKGKAKVTNRPGQEGTLQAVLV